MVEIIIIIIALVWGFLSVFGSEPLLDFQKEVWPSSDNEQTKVQTPDYTSGYTHSQENEPSSQIPLSPAAIKIVSGPYEGEVLNETNKVTFEFELKQPSEDNVRFETKIEGFDNDWVSSYSQKRSVTLPAGPKEYTFMVRERDKNQTPTKRNFKINVSPYFEKIEFDDVEAQTISQPSLITLDTDLDEGETINMTGWKLKGKRQEFIIPKAAEKYHQIFNAYPNDNLIVRKEDKIYLSSASTPIGPIQAFKINECFGYLLPLYNFILPVEKNCPSVQEKDVSHLDDCCQEYLLSAPSCEAQKDSYLQDAECREYISNNLNYAGCFSKYSKDSNFLENEWHIYLGKNMVITGECNTLYLYDQNGLFVDKYQYGQENCQY